MAVLGIASLGIVGIDVWQRELVVDWAGTGDANGVTRASRWLAWIGRDTPGLHVQAAQLLWQRDRPDAAVAEFRRSLELHPTPAAWVGLGKVYASGGSWSEASEAFAAALAENPDHVTALVGAGHAWLQLGRPDLARQSLERARTLAPGDARLAEMLRRAIAAERASSR